MVGTYGVRVIPGPGAAAIGCATVTSNDATVTSNIATASIASSNCAASPNGSFTLNATGSGNTFTWYSAASGGTILGSGNPATISITGPTTVYVENTTTSTVGPTMASAVNDDGGGGATWNQTTFTALQSFTLVSVWVRAACCGTTVTLNASKDGVPNTHTSGAQTLVVGTWRQIILNWPIVAGSTYVITYATAARLSLRYSYPTTSYGGMVTVGPNNANATSGAALDWVIRTGPACLRGAINLDCPAPVSYLSFDAERTEGKVQLDWITVIEKDAKEFIIERSSNGKDFTAIGTVAAKNSKGGAIYSFDDVDPLTGATYYRLRQVDLNGEIYYSEVRMVQSEFSSSLSLMPNPSNGIVLISQQQLNENSEVNLIVYDALGKEVLSSATTGSSLRNGYQIDISDFAKGSYLLKVISAQQVWVERLVKE